MLAWVVIDRQLPRHFRNSRPVRALPLPSSRFYFQSKIPTGSGRFNVQMSPIPPRLGFYSHFGSHPSPSLSHIRHPLSPLFSCTCQKLNSFIFNRFRTLCKKPPGVGGTAVPARFAEKGTF